MLEKEHCHRKLMFNRFNFTGHIFGFYPHIIHRLAKLRYISLHTPHKLTFIASIEKRNKTIKVYVKLIMYTNID